MKLSNAQRKYSATKGELAGCIIFIRKFRYYLQCRDFILRTDHKALEHIRNLDNPTSMVQRWLETLSNYNFKVVHRPGKKHTNADSLSRIEHAKEDPELTDISDNSVCLTPAPIASLHPRPPTPKKTTPLDKPMLAAIMATNYTAPTKVEEWAEEQRNCEDHVVTTYMSV